MLLQSLKQDIIIVIFFRKKQANARMTQMSQLSSKKVIAKAENGKGIELQVIKGNEAKNKQLQGKEMLQSK